MKTCLSVLSTLALCIVFGMPAHADTVSFALDNANLTGTAGDTLTFSATITTPAGNGGDVYLNGLTLTDVSPLTTDITDFLINFPFTLGMSDSASGDLFTVILPGTVAPGTYFCTATLLGGADFSAQDDLGSQLFTVTVLGATSPVPEPGSLVLVATALSGVLATRTGRRRMRS